MADDDRGAHLRALERMGIRLVPRPPEAFLERVALLVALCGCPNLIAGMGVPRDLVDTVLGAAAPALAEVGEWLSEVGVATPLPAEVLARLTAMREAMEAARPQPTYDRRYAARAVGCPRCGAAPGTSCRVTSRAYAHTDGVRYVRAHRERVVAWRSHSA